MKRFVSVLFFLFFINTLVRAQVILNAYAKISAVAGSSVLTVVSVNEANHTFTVGGQVIVMQMQDNVIGTNTTNVATFGDLSAIGNAGNFEVRTILSRSPAAGTPTTVTLSAPLVNTYNTGANSSVQLITFRNLGSNFTTTSAITGLTWDGNVGGVIAIEVTNTLTLEHPISADLIGFRQGLKSAAAGGGCNPTTYISATTSEGFKGEGIYKNTTAGFTNARGHILNGGGAGNEHNAGGAGGGNYTAGGAGGPGYNCGTPAGGIGGIGLSTYISASRVFMGGGGGGGGQNNAYASDGMNGGGIVLIKANTLMTNNTCGTPIRISANGGTAVNVGNDGAGGGGAAGSIILNVTTFSITSTCTLAVNANGGNGGTVTDGTSHAGGGGGGQGAVMFSTAQPTTNMQTTALNGAGGQNNSGGTFAGSGAGSNNSGVIPSASGPLPVELVDFSGELRGDVPHLTWTTASEKSNAYFTLERSADGKSFAEVIKKAGAGTTKNRNQYYHDDVSPFDGINYYRLRQTDFSGTSKYFPLIYLVVTPLVEENVYPNPVDRNGQLTIKTGGYQELFVYDMTGRERFHNVFDESTGGRYLLPVNSLNLTQGVYFVKLQTGVGFVMRKIVVQ